MATGEYLVGDRYCAVCGWGPCLCNWEPFQWPPISTPTRDPALRKAALEALCAWEAWQATKAAGDLGSAATRVDEAMDALREELAK